MAGMPAAGHVNPSLGLVRELVRQHVQVIYYATEEFRDPIERTGAEFRSYPAETISANDIAEATRSGPLRVVTRILTATESLLPFMVADLRSRPPDAVAFDSNAVWGRMAAVSLGLPTISCMTTMMTGSRELRRLTGREWTPLPPDRPTGPARGARGQTAGCGSLRQADLSATTRLSDVSAT